MSKRVLVVDDSLVIRKQVSGALRGAGFEVVEAIDGADALAKIKSDASFAAIVCDVNMPNMDGIQFLEESQKTNNTAPPVVMLTTEAQPALMERARKAGAKGLILKPFKADLVVAAARKLAGA